MAAPVGRCRLPWVRWTVVRAAKTASKVAETRLKPTKTLKNTKKTVEMPDLPLTRSGERPHGDPR
jgi:hypothetical protein